jgi:DNA-directed RNA polymerase specialized sigma24 family protein
MSHLPGESRTETELRRLHRALLEDDPTASERFVAACDMRLLTALKRRFPVVPREIIVDAVTDTLLAFISQPEHYRPERGDVMSYLVGIGSNKIYDQLRSLRQRREHLVGGAPELALMEATHFRSGTERAGMGSDTGMALAEAEALLQEILPDLRDRRLWDLIKEGRASVAEYAAILEIEHLPLVAQKAEAKRNRDRIMQRIKRRREEFRRLL